MKKTRFYQGLEESLVFLHYLGVSLPMILQDSIQSLPVFLL